jgi:hypothetical protein
MHRFYGTYWTTRRSRQCLKYGQHRGNGSHRKRVERARTDGRYRRLGCQFDSHRPYGRNGGDWCIFHGYRTHRICGRNRSVENRADGPRGRHRCDWLKFYSYRTYRRDWSHWCTFHSHGTHRNNRSSRCTFHSDRTYRNPGGTWI